MIKMYLDWNVMSQMKNGTQDELLNIVTNKKMFILPYSSAHISDIYNTPPKNDIQKGYIQSDLEFISKLTNNVFLSIDKDKSHWGNRKPKDIYDDRNLTKDISLDNILDTLSENMTEKQQKQVDKLINTPIEPGLQAAIDNNNQSINVLFPDAHQNMTFGNLIKGIQKLNTSLNESDGYKRLRELFQGGLSINRDRIFDSKDPYKLIEKAHSILPKPLSHFIKNTYGPSWYNNITNEYLLLDMHGYQEDNVNINPKKRKETFKNTTEDAFHTAFGAMCDIYVLNDNKAYRKAKLVYEKTNQNTLIFKPKEFIDFYKNVLDHENVINPIDLVFSIIEQNKFYETIDNDMKIRTFSCPYYIFKYFNKISQLLPLKGETETIVLQKFHSPENTIVFRTEIESIISELTNIFGNDNLDLGELVEDEIIEKDTVIRTWNVTNAILRLRLLNGFLQFYIEFDTKQKS